MSEIQNYGLCQEERYSVWRKGEGRSLAVRGFSEKDAAQRWAYANAIDGTAIVVVMPIGDMTAVLYEVSGPAKEGDWIGRYTARLIEERT